MFFNTIPQEGVFTNTTKQMLNIGNVLFKHAVITRVIILGFLFYSTQTTGQKQEERVDGQIITSGQTYFNSSLKKKETATNDYINFYQKYISGIRGQSCPMYPSKPGIRSAWMPMSMEVLQSPHILPPNRHIATTERSPLANTLYWW